MKTFDKFLLSTQFQNRILRMEGNEFQSFFENIMEKAYPDFQKIRPYGNKGDAGNDGYIRKSGIYYQVYAPMSPNTKDANAAKKFIEDFRKLETVWDQIASLKKYVFVFNNKFHGSFQHLEKALSDLEKTNPNIDFNLLLSNDLENIFFTLDELSFLELGFNVDKRSSLENAYEYLRYLKEELQKGNVKLANNFLNKLEHTINKFNDENLSLEYELIKCKCKLSLEENDEAKELYESLIKRFPNDSRSLLHLAEIFLNEKEYAKCDEMLQKAKSIDADYWLYHLVVLLTKLYCQETVDKDYLNAINIPEDPIGRTNCYRVFGMIYEYLGDNVSADKYIEKAIHLNPDWIINHKAKISLLKLRLWKSTNSSQREVLAKKLLNETSKLEEKFSNLEELGYRDKAILNLNKLSSYFAEYDISAFKEVAKETFHFLLDCYFNVEIEQAFLEILNHIRLPEYDFEKLLSYLKTSKMGISDALAEGLICHFDLYDSLIASGLSYFEATNNIKYYDLILNLESENLDEVFNYLSQDWRVSVNFSNTLSKYPDLRKNIIEKLSGEGKILIQLSLLIDKNEPEYGQAFEIIKNLDLEKLNYYELLKILDVVNHEKAFEYEYVILKKLIKFEKNIDRLFNLRLQLFYAVLDLKNYKEAIDLGEQLIGTDSDNQKLSVDNRDLLLHNTIFACLERGKFDKEAIKKAESLLLSCYPENPTYEFKIGVEAEVFLQNDKAEKALESIVQGVKIKKVLSNQEYANLHYQINLRIGNLIDINPYSDELVQVNSFVKLVRKDQWFYIGEENELDAIPIRKSDNKYHLFISKKVGDKISYKMKYSAKSYEEQIELIYPIEKYVAWKSAKYFQELSEVDALDGVQSIEIIGKDGKVDLRFIEKFLKEKNRDIETLFNLYCKNNVPLASLAVTMGGLLNAISYIQQENKGFINFSSGDRNEFLEQMEIARKVVDEEEPFYIDGTSAFFLSQIGLLTKIHPNIPNIMTPQSVINFLIDSTEKYQYLSGQLGQLGYAQGEISFSGIEPLNIKKRDSIRSNILNTVKILESNIDNIGFLSSADKQDCFSERKIHPELCDACILAQKSDFPVMTEDFLYLQINHIQTKKKIPMFFSTLALLRVLYETGEINYGEYLDYFSYFSSYRFRFLPISSDDIKKAIFGDKDLVAYEPKNIKLLNFPLTLSEEYGVPIKIAIAVIGKLLIEIIQDSTITQEMAEEIFITIVNNFPTMLPKNDLGMFLIKHCSKEFEKKKSESIYIPENPKIENKIKRLKRASKLFKSKNILLINKR